LDQDGTSLSVRRTFPSFVAGFVAGANVGQADNDVGNERMTNSRFTEAIRRKLRALTAVAGDAGASENERATAEAMKARLSKRLSDAGAPAGDWTDSIFRLGRLAKELKNPASPRSTKGDWTDSAFRLGDAVRRGKRWLSE
jgi:hypothetical protein